LDGHASEARVEEAGEEEDRTKVSSFVEEYREGN
jgi:hypothetical protein